MTGKPTPDPIEIELHKADAHLRVAWEDDHESLYPLTYLRGFCPCAKCQGHASGWTFIPVESPEVTGIEEVGNYAFKIVWRDGDAGPHTTGIYSFDILRQLCPCDECQRAQGEAHAMRSMPSQS